MAWIVLTVAGLLEVVWAVALKQSAGFTRPLASAVVLLAAPLSFVLLARALTTIPLGTGYAVWTGIGAVGTALYGIVFLSEATDALRLMSIVMVVAGIVGLRLATP